MREFVFPWHPDKDYQIMPYVISGGSIVDQFPQEGDTLNLYGAGFIGWMVAGLTAFLVVHWIVGFVREAIG